MAKYRIAEQQTRRKSEWAMAVDVAKQKNVWLCDSGASCFMGPSDEGMCDCQVIDESVTIGNGDSVKAVKIGKRRMTVHQADGSTLDTILPLYKHVPELTVNLFSVLQALDKG